MKETGKRFLVYAWEIDEIDNFYEDMGIELCDALESGRRDVADYGMLVSSTDSEDEANVIAVKKLESFSCGEVSIYDTKEHIWFN